MAMPLVNKSFGNMVLRECIGMGGAAEVWRAERVSDHQPFAIKVLRPERAEDKYIVRCFEREIEALGDLKHPAIPALRGKGTVEGLPAFAMDYVPGTNLAVLMGKGSVFPALKALTTLVEVTAFLHEQEMVHNDIKLDNAVLSNDGSGRLWLVDFGNIRRVGRFNPLSALFFRSPVKVFGTATYLAPELLSGKKATKQSDIYALGVCCFILLSGKPPYASAATQSSRLRANQRADPAAIGGRVRGIPPGAAQVIDDCLAKEPGDRPKDVKMLLSAVRSLAGRLPEMPWKTGPGPGQAGQKGAPSRGDLAR